MAAAGLFLETLIATITVLIINALLLPLDKRLEERGKDNPDSDEE
jgi:uncharacterized membrane protein YhiD involved in acid resistance